MLEDSDFDLLESFIRDKDSEPRAADCAHEFQASDNGEVCSLCGLCVKKTIVKSNWTANFNKFSRKIATDKTIFSDVQGLGLSDEIVNEANIIYQHVTKNKIIRGKSRKGIICTCVFYASNNIEPDAMSYDQVIRIFRIENKVALQGFKFINGLYNLPYTCFTATPETYIKSFLRNLNVSEDRIAAAIQFYSRVAKIKLSSRPKPQSIAAAFVYYWLQIFHKNTIQLDSLAIQTSVSRLTIEKLEKEIREKMKSFEEIPPN
jgi:transcription initiation factor TFIIIB Brf1 subunit/transcription initiation factor TFIIB